MTIKIHKKPRSVKIQTPEPKESGSGEDASTPQRQVSVTGHPKNCLCIDSGASLHIIFNRELLEGLIKLNRPIKIQAGGKRILLSQIGSLYEALQHLPLPVSACHYSENAIVNLFSFAKLADIYYIICNTRVNYTIYMQSNDNGKYLRLQRDHKFNSYYMDISEANVEEHCHFNTVKKGKPLFSILD